MTDEQKAMVEALRSYTQWDAGGIWSDLQKAADMIEAMASDLKERDSRIATYDKLVAKQAAEIERLRSALEEIAGAERYDP